MTCVEQPVCELPTEDELTRRPSQHFSVSTPRGSPRAHASPTASLPLRPVASPTPVKSASSAAVVPQSSRDAGGQGQQESTQEQLDADAEKMYEWKFEILNTFPREKGIALVDYLKLSHKRRLEAMQQATELSAQVANLQDGLNQCRRWRWGKLLGWMLLISFTALLGVVLGHTYQLGPWLEARTGTVLLATPPQAQSCLANNEDIEKMRDEHEVMSYQIQRMQLDIEDAKKNGRPLVCWPVGDKEDGEED
mmetsp:Transcript_6457/g.11219  ORF Transcript_6457/g.11219 Transcript_6457/m.11219 type:complete len:251 (-) Transcript_6457:108-860(-)